MPSIIFDNISLILLLPLWIFLIIMCGRFFAVYVNDKIIYFLTLLASFMGIGACGSALFYLKEPIELAYPVIRINDFIITAGLYIDKISLIIAAVLFTVSFAVQLFSISYMNDEKKKYRFFALLNLFNFGMAFLLFSPNLFQFYIFWELVGIISYLLIGFDYKNIIKSEASRRVFLINRVGDVSLLTGIILITYYTYSYVGNKSFVTLSFTDFNSISTFLMAYTTNAGFYIICGLFIIASAVKSAQFPFYIWLQDAMEAKLPVSALLHSATLVVAGVYLMIRMMPFLTLSTYLLKSLVVLGLLTGIICSVLASIETVYKKILAYSTSANLGLMFIALGVLKIKVALIILAAHAFIKSMLFILLPKEKGLSKFNFVLFIVASLSLAGVLFAGIGAKEFLFKTLGNSNVAYVYMFICFMTGYYAIRLAALLYKNIELKINVSLIELTAFIILLSGNVLLYIVLYGNYHLKEPYVAAIGGIALAILLFKHDSLERISKTPQILEKVYYKFIPVLYNKFSEKLDAFDKYVFSNYKPVKYVANSSVKFIYWIEINIMEKAVILISNISQQVSKQYMIMQSGNVQTYNAYAFIIITIVTMLVVISFWILARLF